MTVAEDVAGIHVALVRVVSEWTESDLQEQVAESVGVPLDPTGIRALYLIGLYGGALGFGALSERASMSRPTTSKVVTRLFTQGIVERFRSGRTVEVRLTDAGEQAYARLVTAGHRMVDGALDGWAPDEIQQFQSQLTRFVATLSSASAPTLPGAAPGVSSHKEES